MKSALIQQLKRGLRLLPALAIVVSLALSTWPSSTALAGTITSRKVSLYSVTNNNAGSNVPSATGVTYSFSAKPASGYNLGSVEVDICTTPFLGTACTAPTGLAFTASTLTNMVPAGGTPVLSSATTGATPATDLGSGAAAARIRISYTTAQAITTAAPVTFEITGITNTSTVGTFYVRIGFWTVLNWANGSMIDGGAAANSVQAAQNVSFKVQETLGFCVGGMQNSTVAFGSFSSTTITNDCAQSSATAISLGTAPDITTTCITPVATRTATCDDAASVATQKYGFAMLRTNAANGATIGYRPNNNGTTFTNNTLQVASATCTGFASGFRTDSCVNPVNEDQGVAVGTVSAWVTGTGTNEEFGMVIPTTSSNGKSTAVLTNNPGAVSAANRYIGSGNLSGGTACTTGGAAAQDCWNWHRTGTATLASAPSPVDNESLEILFASKASATTPTGAYSVDVDYYAVPTY